MFECLDLVQDYIYGLSISNVSDVVQVVSFLSPVVLTADVFIKRLYKGVACVVGVLTCPFITNLSDLSQELSKALDDSEPIYDKGLLLAGGISFYFDGKNRIHNILASGQSCWDFLSRGEKKFLTKKAKKVIDNFHEVQHYLAHERIVRVIQKARENN